MRQLSRRDIWTDSSVIYRTFLSHPPFPKILISDLPRLTKRERAEACGAILCKFASSFSHGKCLLKPSAPFLFLMVPLHPQYLAVAKEGENSFLTVTWTGSSFFFLIQRLFTVLFLTTDFCGDIQQGTFAYWKETRFYSWALSSEPFLGPHGFPVCLSFLKLMKPNRCTGSPCAERCFRLQSTRC